MKADTMPKFTPIINKFFLKFLIMKKGTSLTFVLFLIVAAILSSPAFCGNKPDTGSKHVVSVKAITEVFGDGQKAAAAVEDPLLFPKDNFTVETKTVKTSEGEKKVTYHSYMHIPYVANPVDKDYQSLNVSVPVEIDGKVIDAKNAPVFFEIGVGGYMSVRNSGGNTGGPGGSVGPRNIGNISSRSDLALAAGYVVVYPRLSRS